MAAPARIDELRHRYAAQPRRYLAPLANALRQTGAFEEAVTMLRAQLAEYPEHLTGHVVLGETLFDMGALADARVAFEEARALDPGNRVVLRYLGEIASLGGDQAGARLWFGRLRAADPYADDVGAQLGGGPTEPPDIDEDEVSRHQAMLAWPDREVQEPQPTALEPIAFEPIAQETFEPLEFVPAVLDPVVGLDLAPASTPHELVGASTGSEGGVIDDRSDPARLDEAAALDYVTAGPFATETMAGLLAAQGHTEQAIALYERLTAERPADTDLRARLAALRDERTVENLPTAVVETLDSSATDAARAALLTAAFADVSTQPRGADDAGATFDRLVTPDRDADPFADVSFDRFFPASESAAASAEPADTPAPSDDDADLAADLARFDAWLHDLAA